MRGAAENRAVAQAHAPDGLVSPIGDTSEQASRERRERSAEYARLQDEQAEIRAIARQIILYRMEHGLTQRQLAERAGTSYAHISRIESGSHKPSVGTLQRLARAMGCRLTVRFEEAEPLAEEMPDPL
jgi:ribosome-binding protein aMBF1 (putative translation factor)